MERSIEGYHRKCVPLNKGGLFAENPLTPAEQDILRLRRDGANTDKAIAEERNCSLSTVKGILTNIREKLREDGFIIRNTADVVCIATSKGWISPDTGLTAREETYKIRPMTENEPASLIQISAQIEKRTSWLEQRQSMVNKPGGPYWPEHLRIGVLQQIPDADYLDKAVEFGHRLERARDIMVTTTIPRLETRIKELACQRAVLAESRLAAVEEFADVLGKDALDRAKGVVEKWRQECGLVSLPPQTVEETGESSPKQHYTTEDVAAAKGVDPNDKRAFNGLQVKISVLLRTHQIAPERGKRNRILFNPEQFQEMVELLSGRPASTT